MEEEKDYFWFYIGGVVVVLALVLMTVRNSEHGKYETSANAIKESKDFSAYKKSP